MPSLSETLASLRRAAPTARFAGDPEGAGHLTPLEGFGTDPGALRAYFHVPPQVAPGCPLVVVLHGCTQSAAGYDHGSGWSALADRFGFAVLFAEQRRANNLNLCFNWFSPGDIRREEGEARSIAEMVAAMIARHPIDPRRVFVTGLSAGGAMTAVMLATYPEVFAAGAVIAGLPYGVATTLPQALERMRGRGIDRDRLGQSIRDASPHSGTWPSISVWHGTDDTTVAPTNATMIVDQWRDLHDVRAPAETDRIGGHVHRTWRNTRGHPVIEEYAIAGMGHGTPIAVSGDEACGMPAAFFLESGISSTYRIAATWGIVPATAPARRAPPPASAMAAPVRGDIGSVIHNALRAAGLKL
ncbi:PHB depolymerase family esterase [soil metagenome]